MDPTMAVPYAQVMLILAIGVLVIVAMAGEEIK
jgi:hypothetical protein